MAFKFLSNYWYHLDVIFKEEKRKRKMSAAYGEVGRREKIST